MFIEIHDMWTFGRMFTLVLRENAVCTCLLIVVHKANNFQPKNMSI